MASKALSDSYDVSSTTKQFKHFGSSWVEQTIPAELGDFDYSTSVAYNQIRTLFGSTIRLCELKYVVYFVSQFLERDAGVKLPRLSKNAKRSFPLLVKYIQTNFGLMLPVLAKIQILDENCREIRLLDSRRWLKQFLSSAKVFQ
jgi:hypothetical protein